MNLIKYGGMIILNILFLLFLTVSIILSIQFNINCTDRLKRAADSNTIDLAKEEINAAVSYLKENNLTSGYTSILYKSPSEDIGFWYKNLTSSLSELENIKPKSSQLEKSNILLKLRETLLDESKSGHSVTKPSGIQKYPNNTIFALWGWISFLFGPIFTAGYCCYKF